MTINNKIWLIQEEVIILDQVYIWEEEECIQIEEDIIDFKILKKVVCFLCSIK